MRLNREAGSDSWNLWMVLKIADNVEAGRMIWRLLQACIIHKPGCIVLVFKGSFLQGLCVSRRSHVYTFLFCTSTLIWKPEIANWMRQFFSQFNSQLNLPTTGPHALDYGTPLLHNDAHLVTLFEEALTAITSRCCTILV